MTDMNVNSSSSSLPPESDVKAASSSYDFEAAKKQQMREAEEENRKYFESKMSIDVDILNEQEDNTSSSSTTASLPNFCKQQTTTTVTPLLLLPPNDDDENENTTSTTTTTSNENNENDEERLSNRGGGSGGHRAPFLNKREMFTTSESSQNSVESNDPNVSFDELKKSLALIEAIDPCEMDLLIKTIKNMFPKVKIHLCSNKDGKSSPTPSLSVKSTSPSPSPSSSASNHLTTMSPAGGSHSFTTGSSPKQTNLSAGYKMTDYRPSSIDNSSLLSSIDRQESRDSGFWSMSKCSFESMKSLSISDSTTNSTTNDALAMVSNGLFKFSSNNHAASSFAASGGANAGAAANNTTTTTTTTSVDLSSPSASTSPSSSGGGQKALGDLANAMGAMGGDGGGSVTSSQKFLAASPSSMTTNSGAAGGKSICSFKKWKIGQAWRYNSSSSNLSEADSMNQSIMSNKIEENTNSSECLAQKSFDGELLTTSHHHHHHHHMHNGPGAPKMNELSSNYPLSYRKSFDSVMSATSTTVAAPLSSNKLASSASTISPSSETPHSQSLQQIWSSSSTSRLSFQFNKNYHDDLSLTSHQKSNSFKAQKRRGKLMRDRTIDNADEQSSVLLSGVSGKNSGEAFVKSNSQSRSTTSPGLAINNNSNSGNTTAAEDNNSNSKYTFAAIQNHPTSSIGYANLNRSASPSLLRDAKMPNELATSLGSNLNGRISPPEKRVSLSFDQYDMGISSETMRQEDATHVVHEMEKSGEMRKSNPHLSNFSVNSLISNNNNSSSSAETSSAAGAGGFRFNSSPVPSSAAATSTSESLVNGLNFNQRMSLVDQQTKETMNNALLYQYEVYKDLQAKLNLKSSPSEHDQEPTGSNNISNKFQITSRNFNLLSPANFSKLAHATSKKSGGRVSPNQSSSSSSDTLRSRKKIGHLHQSSQSSSKDSTASETSGGGQRSPHQHHHHHLISTDKLATLIAQQDQMAQLNKGQGAKHANSSSFDFHQGGNKDHQVDSGVDCNLNTNSIINKSMFRSNSSPSYSSLSSASPTPSSSPSLQYSQAASAAAAAAQSSSSSPVSSASSNKQQQQPGGNSPTAESTNNNANTNNTQDNQFNAAAAANAAATLHQIGQALAASQGMSIPPKFQFKPNFHESFALAKSQFAAMLKPPEIVITESKSDNLIDYDVDIDDEEPDYSSDTDRSPGETKEHKNGGHSNIPDSQHSKQMMFKVSQSHSNPVAPSHQANVSKMTENGQFFKNLSGAFDNLLFKDKAANNNNQENIFSLWKSNLSSSVDQFKTSNGAEGSGSKVYNGANPTIHSGGGAGFGTNKNFMFNFDSLNNSLNKNLSSHSGGANGGSSSSQHHHVMKSSSRNLKPHVCMSCQKRFARSDMLIRHSRLHSGIRPYRCNRCGQEFSRSDHLNTHLRTHTGEKPYSCPHCSYAACRKDMITRHLKVHTKNNRLSLSFDAGEKSNPNELMASGNSSSAASLTSLTPKLAYHHNSLSSFSTSSTSHMLDSINKYNANNAHSHNNHNNHNQMAAANFASLLPNASSAAGSGQDSSRFTQDLRKYDIKSKSTCSLSTL